MHRLLVLLLSFTLYASANTIKIAVAANVSYAIKDLKKAFALKHPDIQVDTILGSSGKLTAQAMHGAPYDMLLSADISFPQKLYMQGVALHAPVVYAKGALAYISAQKRDFSKIEALLLQDDIKKIAIANPKTAPYGRAAKAFLMQVGLYGKLEKKFVFGESISQTLTYALKAADMGIVAKSSLFSPILKRYKEGENWADVNASAYAPIEQGMVILKSGEGRAEVAAFYDFILSKEAANIFTSYGYLLP